MGAILARATARATLAHVRHVRAVTPDAADGLVAEVYRQLRRDFGMLAPPLVLHSPAPSVLAAAWLMLRETLLANGSASRTARETVAAAVSMSNTCPYCVDVHGTALRGLVPGRHAAAVEGGRLGAVPRPALRALAEWARATGTRAGAAGGVPAPPAAAAELAGVAVVFHYLNRMVNVFLVDSPLPPALPATLRGGVRQLVGWMMAPVTLRGRVPGSSLTLLPPAALPPELAWSAEQPRLAEAFARAAAAIDAAGERSVPPAVRELVHERLADWDGTGVRAGRAWADGAVAALAPGERSAGRVALLTAFASYQVGPQAIGAYRDEHPDDRSLVELAAWASLAAARRVASWMPAAEPVAQPS